MGDGHEWLAERFEENRAHLRGVAYRMLGSANEADDAVQEAWLRTSRSDTSDVRNLAAWLTTVVARVCLDMLRARRSRREEPLGERLEITAGAGSGQDPEEEALMADSIGVALLVVLDRLAPAERVAFVLHDMFAMPFEEIAPIVRRSPAAARQLASRARRRVHGQTTVSSAVRARNRKVVEAFLAALRGGDFEGLVAVLDPDVAVHIDGDGGQPGAPREIRGARAWASGAIAFSRMARAVAPALIDGHAGLVLAPRGRLRRVVIFRIVGERIVEVDIIGDPTTLRDLDVAPLSD